MSFLAVRKASYWVGALGLLACHRTPQLDASQLRMCVTPHSSPDGRLHLDGGGFGPAPGDSAIVEISGRERWRGLLDRCSVERPFDLTVWQAPGDTVSYETFDQLIRENPLRPGPWVFKLTSRHR